MSGWMDGWTDGWMRAWLHVPTLQWEDQVATPEPMTQPKPAGGSSLAVWLDNHHGSLSPHAYLPLDLEPAVSPRPSAHDSSISFDYYTIPIAGKKVSLPLPHHAGSQAEPG